MKSLERKMIYITGGASGIGLAMGRVFAAHGAHLLLLARDEQKLKDAGRAVEKSRRSHTQKVGSMSLDVAGPAAVKKR